MSVFYIIFLGKGQPGMRIRFFSVGTLFAPCSGPKGCSYNHEVIVKAGVVVRGNSSIIARL